MKFSIKTELFKSMVSRAIKGASCNKLIPLTSMISIELKSGKLVLHTTDMTNHLYIIQRDLTGDDFSATIQVDQFGRLIDKMTSENISLTLKDNSLEVRGNGVYSIELPMDENGNPIRFPDPLADFGVDEDDFAFDDTKYVNISTIKSILYSVKPAVAVTIEEPCYTGYYVGDRVIGTDTYKIAGLNENLFDTPKIINPEMMNLLDVMTGDKIAFTVQDNVLVFKDENCIVYGTALDNVENFAVDAIEGLLDKEFCVNCKLPKADLLRLLDRLSLFVGPYDNNAIELTFTESELQINSKSNSGTESIAYLDIVDNFKPFKCFIDIAMFSTQIKALVGDAVNLYYDPEIVSAVKISEGNLTQIIALLEN